VRSGRETGFLENGPVEVAVHACRTTATL
jgi:hypothetical protein